MWNSLLLVKTHVQNTSAFKHFISPRKEAENHAVSANLSLKDFHSFHLGSLSDFLVASWTVDQSMPSMPTSRQRATYLPQRFTKWQGYASPTSFRVHGVPISSISRAFFRICFFFVVFFLLSFVMFQGTDTVQNDGSFAGTVTSGDQSSRDHDGKREVAQSCSMCDGKKNIQITAKWRIHKDEYGRIWTHAVRKFISITFVWLSGRFEVSSDSIQHFRGVSLHHLGDYWPWLQLSATQQHRPTETASVESRRTDMNRLIELRAELLESCSMWGWRLHSLDAFGAWWTRAMIFRRWRRSWPLWHSQLVHFE